MKNMPVYKYFSVSGVRCATPHNWRAECSWCNRMCAMTKRIAYGHAVFVFWVCKVFLLLVILSMTGFF